MSDTRSRVQNEPRSAQATQNSDALEWVVSGYGLTLGLAPVPAGRLGDPLGYKQMFLAGRPGTLETERAEENT